MRLSGPFILVLLLLVSCKKTKLEGDLSILVGTWEWMYTVKTDDFCNSFPEDSLIINSPSIDGYSYSLTFQKKGKLTIKKNGKKEKTYRLVQRDFSHTGIAFSFYLNNNEKKAIRLFYRIRNGKSCLETNDLPFGVLSGFDGCEAKYSLFEKVE